MQIDIKGTTYQSVSLSTTGVTGTIASADLDLDNGYDVCDGVSIVEIANGGITNGQYKVAIHNQNGPVVKPVPIQAVSVTKNDGTNPNERFLDVLFDAKSGNKARIEVTLPAAPGTALIVEATFRLRKTLKPVTL